ncbi:hypothetical protein T484DRAFT_1844276 [Baffinella frigidus]|nr:hypothetical protein T484DRAFT_1844276 [Cryptophyta sp. CCMP2293]
MAPPPPSSPSCSPTKDTVITRSSAVFLVAAPTAEHPRRLRAVQNYSDGNEGWAGTDDFQERRPLQVRLQEAIVIKELAESSRRAGLRHKALTLYQSSLNLILLDPGANKRQEHGKGRSARGRILLDPGSKKLQEGKAGSARRRAEQRHAVGCYDGIAQVQFESGAYLQSVESSRKCLTAMQSVESSRKCLAAMQELLGEGHPGLTSVYRNMAMAAAEPDKPSTSVYRNMGMAPAELAENG